MDVVSLLVVGLIIAFQSCVR